MQKFTLKQAAQACGAKLFGDEEKQINKVQIDSRKVAPGTLFVAIPGENTDGHKYIKDVYEKQAAGSVCVQGAAFDALGNILLVDDSTKAIGSIAHAYKELYNLPTVAITGSVGKTTTKDMIAAVMECMGDCLKTQGNFNNELGLPLTIFDLEENHKSIVLEMGMSAKDEIDYLAKIAKPDVAVITNIGVSHIENLGSRENILKAKMEICNYFGKNNLLIINNDDDMLNKVSKDAEYNIQTYGMNGDADWKAVDIRDKAIEGVEFTAVSPTGENVKVAINVPGIHNVLNALAAMAVANHYGIDLKKAAKALENFRLTSMRMTVEKINGVTIINDCYNAAPDSVNASLEVLKKQPGRRIAILGDMLELGDISEQMHSLVGKNCTDAAEIVIIAGDNAKAIARETLKNGITTEYFLSTEEAAEAACMTVTEGDSVLIKASRGMHFEKIYESIKEKLSHK